MWNIVSSAENKRLSVSLKNTIVRPTQTEELESIFQSLNTSLDELGDKVEEVKSHQLIIKNLWNERKKLSGLQSYQSSQEGSSLV